MAFLDETGATIFADEVKTYVSNTAVAKETGKGLSTNDYTTEEKNKLDGLNDALLNKLGESTEGSLTYNGNEITSKADSELSTTSENPVQNKIITVKLNEKADSMVYDESNSKLKLMNGETVLSEVTVSGGGSANGATIGVLTSESTLIGKEVVLSKDGTTVKTGRFNVSGICTFSGIEETGTYTVTSTDGTDSASNDVTITTDDILNKSILQVTIDFTLDGLTATPLNDVSIWLRTDSTGSSLNAGHTTLAEVIADTSTLSSLMADESAMNYLARSTGFAEEGCASETFMTYLGASTYVDSTVLNSDLWKQKIKASQYWELVYTTVYTIHAGASETITIDGVYGSFTTNADGTVNHALPLGELTLTGSVSGQSFTRTVASSTTTVYVMPEGALYWYGNECTDVTGGWELYKYPIIDGYSGTPDGRKDTNNLHQNIVNYCGSDYVTKNKIDSKQYTKMKIIGTLNVVNNGAIYVISIINTKGTNGGDYNTRKTDADLFNYPTNSVKAHNLDLDLNISNFNNYVGVLLTSSWASSSYADIYAIWLE